MAVFVNSATQTVEVDDNIVYTSGAGCNNNIMRRTGSGVITLKGCTSQCKAKYLVIFSGNIAVATGGTVGEISIGLSIDGEDIPTSQAIVTPAAVGDYFNVTVFALVDVTKGCCASIAIKNTSDTDIDVQSAQLLVRREA